MGQNANNQWDWTLSLGLLAFIINTLYFLTRLSEIGKTSLVHDSALREIFQKLLPLLEPPPAPPKPEIGFHVKEDAMPYRMREKLAGG